VSIAFDIAGEIFTLPEDAVVLIAEELLRIKTSYEPEDDEAAALARKLERRLVGSYEGPIQVTRDDAVTILRRKSLDVLSAAGPYRVPARNMLRAITETLDVLPLVDMSDPDDSPKPR
jgi:hypothetical protein